jgi:small subunit ribosomal protein S12
MDSNNKIIQMVSLAKLLQGARKPKISRDRKKALQKCPQKWGICLRVYTTTPKKPNSGIRKIAKIKLSNLKNIIAHIPGIGHNLQEHACVLVRGGRVRDIPGIQYRVVRGLLDCKPVLSRKTSRSKYSVKKR